jgi:hypothetical protein
MPGKYDEMIYKMLNDEPVTPNEVALKLRITQKTAQKTLMQLALTRSEVRYKSSGRIHLFWKSSPGDVGTGSARGLDKNWKWRRLYPMSAEVASNIGKWDVVEAGVRNFFAEKNRPESIRIWPSDRSIDSYEIYRSWSVKEKG